MSTGPPIEWATPALRFDQRKTVLVPLPRFPKSISQRLCFGIREEQSVRDIVSSFHGEILLAERINPPIRFKIGQIKSSSVWLSLVVLLSGSSLKIALRSACNRSIVASSSAIHSGVRRIPSVRKSRENRFP